LAAGYYYFRPGIQRPQARRRPPRKATRCPGPTRRAWCVCSHLANPGSCEPATTPPRALAKTVCTHNGDPAGSPTKLRYGRFSTISCAAQPSSRALETFSRPDPGAATPRPSKSAARWCAA